MIEITKPIENPSYSDQCMISKNSCNNVHIVLSVIDVIDDKNVVTKIMS